MTKWRCGYDRRNWPATSLLQGIGAFRIPPALRFNQWSPNGPHWFKGPLLPVWHSLYAITIETIVALTRKAPRTLTLLLHHKSTQAAHIRNVRPVLGHLSWP